MPRASTECPGYSPPAILHAPTTGHSWRPRALPFRMCLFETEYSLTVSTCRQTVPSTTTSRTCLTSSLSEASFPFLTVLNNRARHCLAAGPWLSHVTPPQDAFLGGGVARRHCFGWGRATGRPGCCLPQQEAIQRPALSRQ